MGKYDNLKGLTLPSNIVKNSVSTVTNSTGQKVVGAMGNEGIILVDWIQERIDDGSIDPGSFPSIGTNLSSTRDSTSVSIRSDTGTDATISVVTTSFAGVMSAQDKVNLESLITLSGIAAGSIDLGTFTSTIIPDNSTIYEAFQALEQAVNTIPSITLGDLTSINNAITIANGVNAVNGDVSITFNPGNVDLATLGGSLELSQLDTTGATNGQFIAFNGTNYVPFTFVQTIPDHNDLTNIQGGTTNEYYHLTSALHTQLTAASSNILLGRVATSGVIQQITLGGSLAFNSTALQLVNDSAAPGNLKYYGTDGSGVKGWYTLSAIGTVTNVSATNSADLTFTVTNPSTTPDITAVLTNTGVTAGTYGSSSNVPVITVNSKGRVTGASNTAISITSANISNFSEAVQDEVAGALVAGTNISLVYDDVSNTLTINNTASYSGVTNRIAYWSSPSVLTTDADLGFDGTYLTLGQPVSSLLAKFTSKGTGSTLSTYGYVHQNSSNVDVFKVADNGAIYVGALNEVFIHPDAINLSTGGNFPISVSGGELNLYSDLTVTAEGGGTSSNIPSFKSIATRSSVTGSLYNAQILGNVTLASGSNSYTDLLVETRVNQTSHTGAIIGVSIRPVITAANNYRALQIDAPGQTAIRTVAGNVRFDFGSDAEGDLFYRSSTGNLVRLGVGSASQVLGSDGTVPTWISSSSSLPSGTNGDFLIYSGGSWISATQQREKITGVTGTTFNLATTPLSGVMIMLFRNGVLQDDTDDYTIVGTLITMNIALVSADKITTIYYI